MNLPNSLTLTRICLAPLLVVVLLTNFEGRTILGVSHEIVGALISLVRMEYASALIVTVIIGREFAVTALRQLAYARGVAMPASRLGKVKMVAQVVAILALILAHGEDEDRWNSFKMRPTPHTAR